MISDSPLIKHRVVQKAVGGVGNGNPLQYPCLENPMDSGAWWPIVHEVTESQDTTEGLSTHTFIKEGRSTTLRWRNIDRTLPALSKISV